MRSSCSEGDGESGLAPPPSSVGATLTPCHCGSGAEKDDVNLRLYQAALAGDLVAMASALAEGAEVNGSIVGKEAGRTALIGAAVGVKKKTTKLEVAVLVFFWRSPFKGQRSS